jgi:hypothetical protein
MSAPRAPNPARVPRGWRRVALAALAIAMAATAAEGKVAWDGEGAAPLVVHPRDGVRERCRSQPLFRAERLARREAIIVQRSGVLLMPYLIAPYPLVAPALPSLWLWSDHSAGAAARECE